MDFPKRKHPRLKTYNYSKNGYYFVTIGTQRNLPILSTVGRGLAPADAKITLMAIGKIAEQQLLELEKQYRFVRIDKYVVMPTHIHLILVLAEDEVEVGHVNSITAGASPRPTISDIICSYKSLTTRICNKNDGISGRKIFQTSFYEHIIRNESSYQEIWQYIDENPKRWQNKVNTKINKKT